MNLSVKSVVLGFCLGIVCLNATGQSISFDSLINAIDQLDTKSDPDQYQILFDLSQEFFEDNNIEWDLGKLASAWGDNFMENFRYDSAITYYQKALDIEKEGGDSLALAQLHYQLGIAYEGKEEYILSTEVLLKSLNLYQLLEREEDVAQLYLSIGNNFYYSGDENIAFRYYDDAARIFQTQGNALQLSKVLANRASLHNIIKQNDSALFYYEKAYGLVRETENTLQKIDICIGLGIVYEETGDLESAFKEYSKVKKLAAENNYLVELAQAIQNLGYYFLAKGDLDSAEWYAQNTLQYAEELNSFQLRSNAYEILHQVYYKKGQFRKAYDHLNVVRDELDSVFNENSSKQLNSLFARYQIEKNENILAQMELELQLQRLETRRIQNFRNLLLVVLVAALFIVFLFIRGQKLKERTNRLLKKKNDEIRQKNEEIRKIEEAKNKWFLNIAHDLRTPITLIKGPLEQLSKLDYFQGDDKTLMNIASRSIQQLENLTNEILDLSKLQDSRVKLNRSSTDLGQLVKEVMESFESYAHQKQVRLLYDPVDPGSIKVEVDKDKIRKVLNNLLSNAVRFTPEKGRITLTLSRTDSEVLISIRDTGVGIRQDEIPKIFERFYQASNQDEASSGGSGIGLAFSKEIMELHGGKILVTSAEGEGSCFEAVLPCTHVIESPIGEVESPEITEDQHTQVNGVINPRFKGRMIYLADDNMDMRQYIVGFLSDKFLVKQFRDGKEVIDEMNRKTPDMVISDIMMPRMDGVSLAEKIKENSEWKSIPFIALSAVMDEQVKMDTLRIGVDDFIVKPFNPEELLIRIENLLVNYENRMKLVDSKGEEGLESFEEKLLVRLEEEVQKHIANPDFNVLRLADAVSISERQLYRYLKQATGYTPANFVKEIRLQRSFELARRSVYTTTAELAYAVGFKHPNYFASVFRKRFGRKPSEFLKGL